MMERYEIGSDCPQCGGVIRVLNSLILGESRVRYLGCGECGWRPEANKQVVPLEHAPRRAFRINRRRSV